MAKKKKKKSIDVVDEDAYRLAKAMKKSSKAMRKLVDEIEEDIQLLTLNGDPNNLVQSLRNMLGTLRVDSLVLRRRATEWELYALGVEPRPEEL